ncbi:hypothetical protein FMUND_6500 [Fusarium mundagurra]|uniref:PD-(D/E)XK nuclease-like domain-containing protein n=1 Tax=Fusarium mundagurra TaxID=1567541 RepID=A0A8H6DIG2_9HYPO|nr:hypothetical protein FMUND_6500 [Fusarium mundagurra]
MSLHQRVQVWLSNIQQSTDDPSPTPEPYPDVPPNPMKRRRVDSPPRETRQKVKCSSNDPLLEIQKRCFQHRIGIDMLSQEMYEDAFRPPKKRATANNQVSSELQQQYCNFISYSTGKVERRLISRIVEPISQSVTTPSRVTSATGFGSSNSAHPLRSEEVKVEPDTEPVSWPRQIKTEPNLEPMPPAQFPRETRVESAIEPPQTTLSTLLNRINDIYAGRGIFPPDFQDILDLARTTTIYKDWTWLRVGFSSDIFSSQRRVFGRLPGLAQAGKIMHQAALCAQYQAPLSEWNMEVVHKLLEVSLRDENGFGPQFVDFRSSAGGEILREYHSNPDTPQPPDFCVYLEPARDKNTTAAIPELITHIQKKLHSKIFNHIRITSLQSQRPIAFHIHNLPHNTNHELQRVRTAVTAHWALLRDLVRLREMAEVLRYGWRGADPSVYELPEFLPGVIIYKHNWFISIWKEGEKDARFYGIGDTVTSIGVFKIIYSLQVLQYWVKNEYWPWMEKLLLGWPLDWDGRPMM